ncbi:hypothetical protein D5085_10530 [Ectothiorhodospiraceae bacterium BW-2]|nr:hypothetical protein D5085_10530 [Ectothiorhodospiraceae bacterium BW-2]
MNWPQLNWSLFQSHLSGEDTEWVMAADEVVVTKSGKKTYGLERFFSSIYGKTVPRLCFFSLSLINVKRRSSHPMLLEPIIKEAAASCPKGTSSVKEKKSGRPKGSSNRNLKEVPECQDTLRPPLMRNECRIRGATEEIHDAQRYYRFTLQRGYRPR